MLGNSFGESFRITTFGESHGKALGVVIDGCPAGLELVEADIQIELDRRRPGQSDVSTPRDESDEVQILSGVFEGKTPGMPIAMIAFNKDFRSEDYDEMKHFFRPSHADYTYAKKYGVRDWRGGGRSSARETWARVAAGAVAKKYLRENFGVEILSYVEQVGDIVADVDYTAVSFVDVEKNKFRCPDDEAAVKMEALIKQVADDGDSLGGVIKGVLRGVPVGLGEPVFEKLHANLGKAMLGINAVKGFEIGRGFEAARMRGSEHNDEFIMRDGEISTATNNAGGVLGGISSGEDIYFRVAFKPVATISKKQKTVSVDGEDVEFEAKGRHDVCVVPRAVPIVDAMAAIVLMNYVK
jgi:chorismate synthase